MENDLRGRCSPEQRHTIDRYINDMSPWQDNQHRAKVRDEQRGENSNGTFFPFRDCWVYWISSWKKIRFTTIGTKSSNKSNWLDSNWCMDRRDSSPFIVIWVERVRASHSPYLSLELFRTVYPIESGSIRESRSIHFHLDEKGSQSKHWLSVDSIDALRWKSERIHH